MNSIIGPEGSRPRRFLSGGRNRIILSLLFVAVVLASITFTVNDLFFARAQSSSSPLMTAAQVAQMRQQLVNRIHVQPALQRHVLGASNLPTYNNVGTSDDKATSQGNFDNGGASYSAEALAASGITPNQTFVYDGITFSWPGAAAGSANNDVVAGQVVPVTPVANATTLGFIGAANNGPSAGTATITYTDNSTAQFSLGMSDWTLGAGKVQPAFGNRIVTALLYRNTKTASNQKVKTYLFYTSVTLDPTKTLQSVKLPTSVNAGRIHIFAVGTRAAYTNLYNNTALSDDANPTGANFDGAGASYSYQSFITQSITPYLAPGSTVNMEGVNFAWPDTLAGTPDNYQANGQTVALKDVAVSHAVRVAFIGSATDGPSCGTAFINYAGGNRQSFSLCLSDWTLNALHSPVSYENIPFNIDPYRNIRTGQQNVTAFAFYTEVRVDPTQIVTSVTLPASTTQGTLHIFAVGASASEDVNNVGARQDAGSNVFVNFDGAHAGYSIDAMNKAGLSAPDRNTGLMSLTFNKVQFEIPYNASFFYDNTVSEGQTFAINPTTAVTRLAFLGSAANGAQSGTATIIYTDGTTQNFTLGFNDWTTPAPLRFNNSIALTMPYRDTLGGKQNIKNYLYYMQQTLTAGKTIEAVTLPNNQNLHIYAISLT